MTTNNSVIPATQAAVLTDDQRHAYERLLALAHARASTTEAALPTSVLGRWSVPLLVGPAGSGKGYACEEAARRLGCPCRRWDVGSWIIKANRTSHTTSEQIWSFIHQHAAGCVVYLSGVDSLAVTVERGAGYYLAMASEVGELLDHLSARSVRLAGPDGGLIQANVLAVAGGGFPALWGDKAVGGPSGAEAWQLADPEPLADPAAVTRWLRERSGLPTGILRRLAAEPMVVRGIAPEEAARLAVRLRDNLPPALDGLGADEFREALQSPHGWRAVAALVERAWVDGHDLSSMLAAGTAAVPAEPDPPADVPETKPSAGQPPARLGQRLGIPHNRSRLLGTARRLGLRTVQDFDNLAVARGFLLPDGFPLLEEDQAAAVPLETASRDEINDVELAVALLSPCLDYSERAICRGALMLGAQVAANNPAVIVYAARRARGETVVRHVARIGRELDPHAKSWQRLLILLPGASYCPALPPGILPDYAIRVVLATLRP